MNIQKWVFSFFIALAAMPIVVQAQQYGVADITTAKSGAMKVQIQQFEATVKQLQDTITTLNAQLQQQEAALTDVDTRVTTVSTKINDPVKGVDAINNKIQGMDSRPPEIATAKTYCTTATGSMCDLNCRNYPRNGDGTVNRRYHPYNQIHASYDVPRHTSGSQFGVKILSAHMQFNSNVDLNPNKSGAEKIVKLGGVDYDSGATSANCRATQVEYCAQYEQVCVEREAATRYNRNPGCKRYADGSVCASWSKKYVATQCEATCGVVAYRKAGK